ncbi:MULTISPECIES: dephospho-CoA kinase [unclassified Neisseria]|uniref:dephospho-CoA kinase n=1 Tax=unclassified Neisseria TaxID=2623750 RepID=UPI0010723592|nr:MULTISPECIES: dephospho-CoA kinase [unclassified Neisseria]MBF0803559.1 dephospho-CoA kinase [Neisseria sp. 19428wB4_WF04]TFU43738.1 dephospho-CoA kinase [Neisseria sp. WF04]
MVCWVGLTGGIGSGKSQAAAEFARLGVPVIDADAVSRSLTADNGAALPEIRKALGNQLFDAEGRLKRAALRDMVFRRPQAKQILENIMHPLILAEIRRRQSVVGQVYGVVDIPLLIERPVFSGLTERILVVDVSETTQVGRVYSRSGLETEEIKRIMASQARRRDRLLAADDVLSNEGTLAELAGKVRRLHRYYLALFSCFTGANP